MKRFLVNPSFALVKFGALRRNAQRQCTPASIVPYHAAGSHPHKIRLTSPGFGIVRSNLILRWFMACKQLAVTATRSSVAGRSDSECTSIAANVGGRIQ
jgi:hypothetical protein